MNENNQAISSYDYDAWGNPMNSTVSEESAYRYTGREYDEETGLHNFRARLYDSTLMRFYQVDPAEQFASPYVYCGNNPIGLVDPDGRLARFGGSRSVRNELFDLLSTAPIRTPITMDRDGYVKTAGSFAGEISEWEQHFIDLLNDPNNLVTISVDDDGLGRDHKPIMGGVFDRISGYRRHGFQADMVVYMPALQLYNDVGGCDIGSSFVHEFGEGYKGLEIYSSNIEAWNRAAWDRDIILKYIQDVSHNFMVSIEPDQFYPAFWLSNKYNKLAAQRMENGHFLVPNTWTCEWECNGNKASWEVFDPRLEVTGGDINENE
jgi:RHS repeat-associated protein